MADVDLPRILIVDDVDAAQHALGLQDRAQSRARHPNDVEADDLDWADLVLMDFMIEHWDDREALDQVALRPPNGLALAAVLREHADSQNGDGDDYTAFAIHTGHVGEISRRLHTSNKAAHVVARLNNLEWVFDKSDGTRFERSTELGSAVRVISSSWKEVEDGGVEAALERLLGLSGEVLWHSRAFDDVVLCQVPLSEFSAGTNGLLFLRWLLHSILPYPTFLWAEQWVAARLRITPASLRAVLDGESDLAADINACRYDGILSGFLGTRWWRAGVEQYAWGIRAEGARDPVAFHKKLEERAGGELERLEIASPVVCIERDLSPADELCSLEDAVRMVPDLWPAYAGTAYATIARVRDDAEFAAVVHPLDRERIADDDDDDAEE
jgi:CheY-like chemotaxis protein